MKVAIGVLLITALLSVSCTHKTAKALPIVPKDGVFYVDDKDIGNNEVRFYSYAGAGKTISFLVARGSSGEVKTAFDACQTCYTHKRGYSHEKECVICAHCGMPIKIDDLEKGEGNCVPVMIPHRLEGGRVLIDEKDVLAGEKYF
jgi:uncharacterized membrane protein